MLSDIPTGNIDGSVIKNIVKPRDPFTHKGDYGHACLFGGSIGMMGAAVLAVKACLRSGTGKVTVYTPGIGYDIMQISAPEAMTNIAGDKFINSAIDIHKFDSLGIGPGLGLYESHKDLLQNVFSSFRNPIVIDADALNIIAENKDLLKMLPEGSILTPHKIEFERLFGKTDTDAKCSELAMEISHKYKIYVVLKGHHTSITTPEKKIWLNTTGNAGMATGGSGDVLTGILTGLLAQNYSCLDACLLGVYLHGLAGDIAAEKFSQQAMIAGDIINCLGEAFKSVDDGID
ncbi:MAG: NAD(P)H-hydrate dehydratase [Chitinophagaceae bacterium]